MVRVGISTENSSGGDSIQIEINNVVVQTIIHTGTSSVTTVSHPMNAGDFINLNRNSVSGGGIITATVDVEYDLSVQAFLGPTGPQGDPGGPRPHQRLRVRAPRVRTTLAGL